MSTTKNDFHGRRKKILRFEAIWVESEECSHIITNSWKGLPKKEGELCCKDKRLGWKVANRGRSRFRDFKVFQASIHYLKDTHYYGISRPSKQKSN